MLRHHLITLALISSLLACGQETSSDTPATSTLQPAIYPKSMPQSSLDDARLIGYWETACEASGSDSIRWSFLLDPTKAVLEKQVYHDTGCQLATSTTRYYLTYTVKAQKFEGRVWEVHANIQTQDGLNSIFKPQTCSLANARDDIWYDLTGTDCQLKDSPSSVERGSPTILSQYSLGLKPDKLSFDIPGRPGLRFSKLD